MTIYREVKESPLRQGTDEEVAYSITTTPWGSSPTSVSAKVFTLEGHTDVTSTMMPTNSPSVASDVITLSPLKSLVNGTEYRVEVKFTAGGNIFEAYFIVRAEL